MKLAMAAIAAIAAIAIFAISNGERYMQLADKANLKGEYSQAINYH
jgi:hypothetical protein